MKSDTLSLLDTLDEAKAMDVAAAINAIKGISKVSIATASADVALVYDDDVTSLQEVRAALQQAGFRPKKGGHGDGSCCGGCGG